MGNQRFKAVHHELRNGYHKISDRHRGHRPARQRQKEISAIIVPSGTEGFVAEPAYNKVGWNASDTHPLTFNNVRVPEANLVGERGRGFAQFLSILEEGRIAIAALACGAAQGVLMNPRATPRNALASASPSATTRRFLSRSPGWKPAHGRLVRHGMQLPKDGGWPRLC